jgi:hypothetical protein
MDIKKLLFLPPKDKKATIENVYEAVQLFQISRYQDKIDVLVFNYKGNNWEHHKPGYYAILCNNGCCSSTAAWLDYFIHDKYSETGYLCFTRPDGTGHVMNYIVYNNLYYIIDLTAMTFDVSQNCGKETGIKKDFISSKYITGHCYRTHDLLRFVRFHSRIQKFHGFEFLYYKVPALPCLPPISIEKPSNGRIIVSYGYKIEILNSVRFIDIRWDEGPNYSPNWNYYIHNH